MPCVLFHISKEHQITTFPPYARTKRLLFHISKEHQITTHARRRATVSLLFHISKEHQITTKLCLSRAQDYCFTFQKSIKSQHVRVHPPRRLDCFTFQKSIKSQPKDISLSLPNTVSHFKRASNHNAFLLICLSSSLFHISKEHQITTTTLESARFQYCFTFQKSIKSQQAQARRRAQGTVSHFKRTYLHHSGAHHLDCRGSNSCQRAFDVHYSIFGMRLSGVMRLWRFPNFRRYCRPFRKPVRHLRRAGHRGRHGRGDDSRENPYQALRDTLKAEIDAEAWESIHSDISRPFPVPSTGRIAVKIINHLGDEVMKVFWV